LDKLDIAYKDQAKTKHNPVHIKSEGDLVVINEVNTAAGIVPNVMGMGAKDAVFSLENAGLRVNLTGKGTVFHQSVSPGTKLTKGQVITIQLK